MNGIIHPLININLMSNHLHNTDLQLEIESPLNRISMADGNVSVMSELQGCKLQVSPSFCFLIPSHKSRLVVRS